MGDTDHCHAVLSQAFHDVQHLPHHLRVQRTRRLIKQHDGWVHRQRACDGNPLLLPTGEMLKMRFSLVAKTDAFEQCERLLLRLTLALRRDLCRCETDVLDHGQMREEIELLKNKANVAAEFIDVQ
ncbi:hypothetical protein UB46_28705 [Burkholderiaceae bacterium 16]|nr:hypothetical protein UB46_28705 [Burkholderiaceae bacterium 16]